MIDNDMLGNVQRLLRGIEVTEETLSYKVIEDTVFGIGHYLNQPQTLALMQTEYLYPEVADRRTPGEWEVSWKRRYLPTGARTGEENTVSLTTRNTFPRKRTGE